MNIPFPEFSLDFGPIRVVKLSKSLSWQLATQKLFSLMVLTDQLCFSIRFMILTINKAISCHLKTLINPLLRTPYWGEDFNLYSIVWVSLNKMCSNSCISSITSRLRASAPRQHMEIIIMFAGVWVFHVYTQKLQVELQPIYVKVQADNGLLLKSYINQSPVMYYW